MLSQSLRLALAAGVACLGLTAAHAQTGKWPEKPVRIIVAAAPGGGDDFVTRLIAPKLGELLGQQFITENRVGVGGMIGQTFVQKSAPDGYTWLLAGGSMAGARLVNANVGYDVLRDFTPVTLLETSPFFMVVHPGVPAKNLKEYITLARARPGNMTFATLGGQMPYWNALLFNSMARIQAVEVPYKSLTDAIVDVISGRIDYYFAPSAQYAANQARLRALAVTSPARSATFPQVPTIAEAALPGYDLPAWRSIMGPAGVRRDIVDTLNAAIRRTLAMLDVRDKMLSAGHEPQPSSPEELGKRYAAWVSIFDKVAKEAGIKPQ
jgi:tripartite-type tricarboxylate transporter receptor subunit TctC